MQITVVDKLIPWSIKFVDKAGGGGGGRKPKKTVSYVIVVYLSISFVFVLTKVFPFSKFATLRC